jgi:hypothetical protein
MYSKTSKIAVHSTHKSMRDDQYRVCPHLLNFTKEKFSVRPEHFVHCVYGGEYEHAQGFRFENVKPDHNELTSVAKQL